MIKREELVAFLNENLIYAPRENRAEYCQGIVLQHKQSGETEAGGAVETWPIKKDNIPDIGKLAHSMMQAADTYAKSRHGIQYFDFEFYIGQGINGNPTKKFGCTMEGARRPGSDNGGPEYLNEGTGVNGAAQMFQRHAEYAIKTSAERDGLTFDRMERDNAILRMEVEQLRKNEKEFWHVYQDLMDRKNDRDIKVMKAKAWDRRIDSVTEVVKQVLPAAVEGFTGGAVSFPTDTTPILEMLSNSLGDLKQEEFMGIAKILGPIRMAPIAKLYQQLKKRNKQREEKQAEIKAAQDANYIKDIGAAPGMKKEDLEKKPEVPEKQIEPDKSSPNNLLKSNSESKDKKTPELDSKGPMKKLTAKTDKK